MRFYSCTRFFEFAIVFIKLQRGELSWPPYSRHVGATSLIVNRMC